MGQHSFQPVSSHFMYPGRLERRPSWSQRSRPGPFPGGGGKWKHDGFEELQQQLEQDAKIKDNPVAPGVAGLQVLARSAPATGKSMVASL